MYLFLTANRESWTGVFYAIEENQLVDLEDVTDASFRGRGILTDGGPIIISAKGINPTHYLVTDREMNETFRKAVALFASGKIPVLSVYGNIVTAQVSNVPWAKYIVHVSYDNE